MRDGVCAPQKNKQINDTALFTRNARKSTNMENLWLFKIGFTFVQMCAYVLVCAVRAHKMLWDTVFVFYMILYHLSLPNACQKHTNSIFCCLAFPSHKTENGYIYSLIFIAHMRLEIAY